MPQTALTGEAGVAQLVGRHPTKRKVDSLIPGQGMCLGWASVSGWGAFERQPIDVSFSIDTFLLLFSLPSPNL